MDEELIRTLLSLTDNISLGSFFGNCNGALDKSASINIDSPLPFILVSALLELYSDQESVKEKIFCGVTMDFEILFQAVGESELTKEIVLFLGAWMVVKKSVNKHFERIENNSKNMADSLQSLVRVFDEHVEKNEERLSRLEEKVFSEK